MFVHTDPQITVLDLRLPFHPSQSPYWSIQKTHGWEFDLWSSTYLGLIFSLAGVHLQKIFYIVKAFSPSQCFPHWQSVTFSFSLSFWSALLLVLNKGHPILLFHNPYNLLGIVLKFGYVAHASLDFLDSNNPPTSKDLLWSKIWMLVPSRCPCDLIKRWNLERWVGHDSTFIVNGIRFPCNKDWPKTWLFCALPRCAMWGCSKIYTNYQYLDSWLSACRAISNKFSLFKNYLALGFFYNNIEDQDLLVPLHLPNTSLLIPLFW